MPVLFFKKFWDTVAGKVKEEVLAVLIGGEIPEGWNDTTVVLILKVSEPERLKEIRPNSHCNVLYRSSPR
jgi:hypothetical protein